MANNTGFSDCWTYPKEVIDEKLEVSTKQYESYLEGIQAAGDDAIAAVKEAGEGVLESIPEDYTQLSEDVSSLKADFAQLEELTVVEIPGVTITEDIFSILTWSDGYMGTNGSIAGTGSNTYRHSQIYPVSEGDVLAFANSNFTFSFITAFTGETVVQASGQMGGNSYTVPSGIDGVVISEYVSRGTAAINYTHTTPTIQKNIYDDAMESKVIFSINPENVTWVTGKYKTANGGVSTASGLNYSSPIPVSAGDILLYANDNYSFRFVCALDSGGLPVQAKGSDSTLKQYIVPDGIVNVIVSVYDSAMNSGTLIQHITRPSKKMAKTLTYGKGSVIARSDTMTDGDILALPQNNCKIGSRYQFSCKITTFGSVEFYMDNTHVIVDDTNVIFKNGTTTQATVPHGLTIATELLITLQNETSIRPSYVSVSSLGSRFEYNGSNNITFLLDNGKPRVKCVEGSLTNCVFSFTSSHIFKPVWVFGDSYLSWYDTRWTYYAAEDENVENVFFSGYAGQNSQSALCILDEEIKLAKPKILVWCLGMNDPDGEDAVNASWYLMYQQVVALCAEYNIELVLYTVPTTPIMNNRFKNAIVKASGYRYVDVDGLVRINDDGDWIEGALDNDDVHPTALGAKLIYHKFLSDLPEIMTK